jgi:hypothetical protein
MDELKITKMPEHEKVYWTDDRVYRLFYQYQNSDTDFKKINSLQSSKEFYEISPKFARSYNITKMLKILKEKFNTEQLVLFAFYRYCGELVVEYTFRPDFDFTFSTYFLEKKDGDIIYKPDKNKAQKFMVAVNPVSALDTLSESSVKTIKSIIAGKKIYETFLKNTLDSVLDKANKNLGSDDLYSKPLGVRQDTKYAQVYFDINSMKKDIKDKIAQDIEKYIYDNYLKPYFKDLGQIPCRLTSSANDIRMNMFIDFEELTNNMEV